MQNIIGKKRVRQQNADSDYLFANASNSSIRSSPYPRKLSQFSAELSGQRCVLAETHRYWPGRDHPIRKETAVSGALKRGGVLKVIVPWVVSGLDVQTNGAPALEIFLRRWPKICESRLPESGRVSQVDRSAEFRERVQADLYRSGTQ
jgi:hypothetical protein